MDYAPIVKASRLEATLKHLNAGFIELLSKEGILLARIDLDDPAGMAFAGLLMFSGFPKYGMAQATGDIVKARLIAKDQSIVADGLTVGLRDADVVMDNVSVKPENLVKITRAEIRHG